MYCTQWVNKNNIDQIRVCFLRIPFGFMYNHKCHHRYHLSKSGNGNYLDVMALSAWFLRSLRQKDSYYLRVSVSSLHRHSTSAQSAYWVGISWRLESNKHSTMMKHRIGFENNRARFKIPYMKSILHVKILIIELNDKSVTATWHIKSTKMCKISMLKNKRWCVFIKFLFV